MAVGWGVGTQALALPGQLARALTSRTGRGADVDLLAKARWDIDSAADAIRGRDLTSYDAIVVILGSSDALRFAKPARWSAGLVALLDVLEEETSRSTGITLMGIQPISTIPLFGCRPGGPEDLWAERLNRISIDLCAGRSRVHYLDPPDGDRQGLAAESYFDEHRYRSPKRFFEWASTLAASMAPFLDAQSGLDRPARVARNSPQPVERRLAALWDLQLLDTPREKQYDDIVRRAQRAFGTRGAAFSLLDERRQWNKSVVGVEGTEWPIEESFCQTTIAHALPFVVEDAWNDDRAPRSATMRFYAGYPVETTDGTRIGALCVFDPEPRPADSVDLTALRDLALAIQQELPGPSA